MVISLLTIDTMKKSEIVIGGRYNWEHQKERLVYLGENLSGNGYWHQFANIKLGSEVWCEVLDSELKMIVESNDV